MDYKPHSTKIKDLTNLGENEELKLVVLIHNPITLKALGEFEKKNNVKSHSEAINLILNNYFIWDKQLNTQLKDLKDTLLQEVVSTKEEVKIVKHLIAHNDKIN